MMKFGLRRLCSTLLAASLLLPGLAAASPAPVPGNLKLERVVMLFRHGVRAPLNGEAGAADMATQPWQHWATPASYLTPHGIAALRLVGIYDREMFAAEGLLPAQGCPATGSVSIWTNSIERTIASGTALAEGLAPGCKLAVDHKPVGIGDPLFDAMGTPSVSFNASTAIQSITQENGGPQALIAPHQAELATLEKILGCDRNSPPCDIAAIPGRLAPKANGTDLKLEGPIEITSGTAQVFLLQYAEGLPLSEVGWGRATRDRITQISRLHALLFDVYARPSYMARRVAGQLSGRMLNALELSNAPALTLFVASDDNIAAVTSLLGVNFKIESYGEDDPPPDGALGFALLQDPHSGQRYVRVFYQAQTLDQLRNLTPLTPQNPPVMDVLQVQGCAVPGTDLCRLKDFVNLLNRKRA